MCCGREAVVLLLAKVRRGLWERLEQKRNQPSLAPCIGNESLQLSLSFFALRLTLLSSSNGEGEIEQLHDRPVLSAV